jgi:hypothetical protein
MAAGKIPPPVFWREQEKANNERIGKPNSQLELVYGMDLESYRRLVDERRDRPMQIAPLLQKLAAWFSWADAHMGQHGAPPRINLGVLGWLLLLGLVACLWPRYFVCRMLLWLPVTLYLFAVFAVGDSVRRYLHPVDWVGIVIIAISLDTVATLVGGGIDRLRGRRAAVDPPPSSARVESA